MSTRLLSSASIPSFFLEIEVISKMFKAFISFTLKRERRRFMKRKIIASLLVILALIVSTLLGVVVRSAEPSEPHPGNAMWIEPSSIDLTTAPIGYKFNVTVWINFTSIDPGDYIGAWQFCITYEKTYLNATRAGYTAGTMSQWFKDAGVTATMPVTPDLAAYNETHNYILHGEVWLMGSRPAEGSYGSLAWIEFELINKPEYQLSDYLSFMLTGVKRCKLLDENNNDVTDQFSFYAAEYKFELGPPPPSPPTVTGATIYVDPPEIIDPTLRPCSSFSVNITLINVTNMITCIFNLTYIPDILGWVSMNLFKVQNQTPTTKIIIDDEGGFLWAKLTYSSPITAVEPTPLMSIQFHVDSLGATPLDLRNTQLIDAEDNPIEHQAKDGYFATLIRDLTITTLTVSRNWVYQGWEVNINVTVKNNGNVNATFWLAVYCDSDKIANYTINNLAPNNETLLVLTWNTTDAIPCRNYTISAKAQILPYETNVADNEYYDGYVKVRILGDVNGDDIVDITDLYEVALYFGSRQGYPTWNPDVDLNRDQIIDIVDLYLTATNFGARCQP